MRSSLRLLFAFFVIAGLAGVLALQVFRSDIAGTWLLALLAVAGAVATILIARALRRLEAGNPQAHPAQDLERMAHTLRALAQEAKAPLSAIHEAAGRLNDDLATPERERLVRRIQALSLQLRAMGDGMAELSRLETRHAIVQPREVDLLALIDDVATSCVPLAIQHGIGLVWEARVDVVLNGDPESLTLLFANLWSNALHVAPEGTSIVVSLRRTGSEAVFTMRDEGPGVSEFELAQLGQRFFSLPRPRDGLRGNGLGLAIVRQAAALHGGDVAFQRSSPGLQVTVRLPL